MVNLQLFLLLLLTVSSLYGAGVENLEDEGIEEIQQREHELETSARAALEGRRDDDEMKTVEEEVEKEQIRIERIDGGNTQQLVMEGGESSLSESVGGGQRVEGEEPAIAIGDLAAVLAGGGDRSVSFLVGGERKEVAMVEGENPDDPAEASGDETSGDEAVKANATSSEEKDTTNYPIAKITEAKVGVETRVVDPLRVEIPPGETVTVTCEIKTKDLAFIGWYRPELQIDFPQQFVVPDSLTKRRQEKYTISTTDSDSTRLCQVEGGAGTSGAVKTCHLTMTITNFAITDQGSFTCMSSSPERRQMLNLDHASGVVLSLQEECGSPGPRRRKRDEMEVEESAPALSRIKRDREVETLLEGDDKSNTSTAKEKEDSNPESQPPNIGDATLLTETNRKQQVERDVMAEEVGKTAIEGRNVGEKRRKRNVAIDDACLLGDISMNASTRLVSGTVYRLVCMVTVLSGDIHRLKMWWQASANVAACKAVDNAVIIDDGNCDAKEKTCHYEIEVDAKSNDYYGTYICKAHFGEHKFRLHKSYAQLHGNKTHSGKWEAGDEGLEIMQQGGRSRTGLKGEGEMQGEKDRKWEMDQVQPKGDRQWEKDQADVGGEGNGGAQQTEPIKDDVMGGLQTVNSYQTTVREGKTVDGEKVKEEIPLARLFTLNRKRRSERILQPEGGRPKKDEDRLKMIRDAPGCFPGSARVVSRSRGLVPMAELQVGEEIETDGGFSKFIAHLHADGESESRFVRVSTCSGREVEVSEEHVVYVLASGVRHAVYARQVTVGDVMVADGHTTTTVTNITHITARGRYAPLTSSGTVMVEGLLMSCYAHVPPSSLTMVHNIFYPWRMVNVALPKWMDEGLMNSVMKLIQ